MLASPMKNGLDCTASEAILALAELIPARPSPRPRAAWTVLTMLPNLRSPEPGVATARRCSSSTLSVPAWISSRHLSRKPSSGAADSPTTSWSVSNPALCQSLDSKICDPRLIGPARLAVVPTRHCNRRLVQLVADERYVPVVTHLSDSPNHLESGVIWTRNASVLTVTLNRPAKRNAMGPSTWKALADIGAAVDSDVR